ncbi:stage III sporulation protein AF [Gracilibacillus ureilyticus]|uniref:Stage III sporulation protein AF n=1 Tax=Gracilibacillus ureilyticus TaxID=531814 RepID=A0A1H9LXR8_9BACI|nr:stage III sporulation protein AF [Gracilibacillus ureilyticus]SER16099.1 stage III sporulation protein AF [Gracilibacillus ureilyticus]
MEYVTSWILQIIIYMILALIVDLILPSSKMKQYAKLVIGVLLILIILQPVLSLFKVDLEQFISPMIESQQMESLDQLIKNETNTKKSEIESVNQAYVLEEVVVQMENIVEEELKSTFQLSISHLEVSLDSESNDEQASIDNVFVQVIPYEEGVLKTVETIEIEVGEPAADQEEQHPENKEVLEFLAKEWQVSEENIIIEWEEEESD